MTKPDEKTCRHNCGFYFSTFRGGFPMPGAWFCGLNCNYYLPFNPDHFPDGVVYTCEPNPRSNKVLPPLAKEGLLLKKPD